MKNDALAAGYQSPTAWLAQYFQIGTRKEGRFTTSEMEERDAALFGYAYAVGKGIDSLLIRPGEGPQKDYDAEFRWQDQRLPVSLKRLPPASVSPKETLGGIIRKAAIKSTGGDLLLAIHVDRAGHLASLAILRRFQIKELCLWAGRSQTKTSSS